MAKLEKVYDAVVLGNQVSELLAHVDRFPTAGDGINTRFALWTSGGMGGNFAQAVARLGGRVALICATGSDSLSDQQIKQLSDAGVDTRYILRRPNTTSPVTVLMIDPDLRRAGLVIEIEAGKEIQPDEIPVALLRKARVFFTDLYPSHASLAAAEQASKIGIPVAFDMQMAAEHVSYIDHSENITRMFHLADYFFCDEENFLLWTTQPDLNSALSHVRQQRSEFTLVVTQGERGSLISSGENQISIPAFSIEVVDTIGAGDAYHGSFLYARLGLGWSLRSSGLLAAAAASLSCTQPGARLGLPDFPQTLQLLAERGIHIPELE